MSKDDIDKTIYKYYYCNIIYDLGENPKNTRLHKELFEKMKKENHSKAYKNNYGSLSYMYDDYARNYILNEVRMNKLSEIDAKLL